MAGDDKPRPVTITPEMIEAGIRASWGSLDAPRFVRKMVIKIFKAMMAAAPQ
jgi:hypothetical protein